MLKKVEPSVTTLTLMPPQPASAAATPTEAASNASAAPDAMRMNWLLVAVGVVLLAAAIGWWSAQDERIWRAYVGGMAAAAATAAGTLPLFF